MVNGLPTDVTEYDRVARVIGEEMDGAWKRIWDKLSAGDLKGVAGADNPLIEGFDSSDLLKKFFAKLGGSNLFVEFASIVPKGIRELGNTYKILPFEGTEGTSEPDRIPWPKEITVGGRIRW